MGTLQDLNGNTSSKRVAGFIGLSIALGASVAHIALPGDYMPLVGAWLGFATAALLGTLLERTGQ